VDISFRLRISVNISLSKKTWKIKYRNHSTLRSKNDKILMLKTSLFSVMLRYVTQQLAFSQCIKLAHGVQCEWLVRKVSGIWFSKFSSFNRPYVLTNVIRFLVQATEKPFTFSTLTGAKFTEVLKTHLTSKLMKWTIHSDFYSVRVCFNFNILMMGINGSLWIELTKVQ
jgi:hypothetical protein